MDEQFLTHAAVYSRAAALQQLPGPDRAGVFTARVFINVMKYYGYAAEPLSVWVATHNPANGRCLSSQGDDSVDGEGDWSGHLAIRVRDVMYVDPATEGLHHPAWGLVMRLPVVVEVPAESFGEQFEFEISGEAGTLYAARSMNGAVGWRKSLGWTSGRHLVVHASGDVIRNLRERYPLRLTPGN